MKGIAKSGWGSILEIGNRKKEKEMAITSVDWESVKKAYKTTSDLGGKIQDNITKAYSEFSNLSSSWIGGAYNKVSDSLTALIEYFNSMMKDVVETIPSDLANVYNTYREIDQLGDKLPTSGAVAPKLSAINHTAEDKFYFDEGTVESARTTITNKIKDVASLIKQYNSTIQATQWQSVTSGESKSRVKTYADKVDGMVTSVSNSFTENINTCKENVAKGANSAQIQ